MGDMMSPSLLHNLNMRKRAATTQAFAVSRAPAYNAKWNHAGIAECLIPPLC
jgi:hypothetical protein